MTKFFYSGDIDIENGGYFYTTENRKYGYSDVLRVIPFSDAGGPDNMYWLESLTVNVPEDKAALQRALDVCGVSAEAYSEMKPAQRFNVAIDACIAYGNYDQNKTVTVHVGSQDYYLSPGFDMPPIDVKLRGNASVKNYALKMARELA